MLIAKLSLLESYTARYPGNSLSGDVGGSERGNGEEIEEGQEKGREEGESEEK